MEKIFHKPQIVFCSYSSITRGNHGDSINNKKLYNALPSCFKIKALSPKETVNNKVNLKSLMKFIFNYLLNVIKPNNIFIIRGSKLSLIPVLFKKISGNKVIVRLGCTPLMFVEKMAFKMNNEYKVKGSIFSKILDYIEPYLEKFVLSYADKFIVENDKAEKIISFYGAKKDRIEIIPYYVQDYFIQGKNPNYNIEKDTFVVGYTGRFKDYDLLLPIIDAISILKKEGYQIKLNLIGDGPKRNQIELKVKEKNLRTNICFLGAHPHKKLAEMINAYHCLVLPMLIKLCPSTISIKILEGVIKGKIIITTKSGNNSSLFFKDYQLFLDQPSAEGIASKLKFLMNNYDEYNKIAGRLKSMHINQRKKLYYKKEISRVIIELITQ